MRNSIADAKSSDEAVVDAIRHLLTRHSRPVLIAIDGPSGSGKSTFALWLADQFEAALIQGDAFFAAGITNAEWDARAPEERAADAIDWRRVRVEALEPLLAGKPAKWLAFDFAAGERPDGTYAMRSDVVEREPEEVYFTQIRPRSSFDLVVTTTAIGSSN